MNKKLKKGITVATISAMGSCTLLPALTVIAAPATTGWRQAGDAWQYYNSSGAKVASTWVKTGENWYYIGATGAMATNSWAKDSSGQWFYLGSTGEMATNSWAKDSSGCWFYLGSNGAMLTNSWVEYKNNFYYLNAGGDMAVSTTTSDGYTVDANGARYALANNNDFSDGNTHTGNYVISSLGTFGQNVSGKTTTINGNVTINYTNGLAADTIMLQNLVINGTLTVNFGAGSLKLNNVKVTNVDIFDVGPHSFTGSGDTEIGTTTLNDRNNDAHLILEGNAFSQNTIVHSGTTLEVASNETNEKPFGNVILDPTEAPSQSNMVTFRGAFPHTNVNVLAPSNVNLPEGSSLNSVTTNSNLSLFGGGSLNSLTTGGTGGSLFNLGIPTLGTLFVNSPGSQFDFPAGTTLNTLNANADFNATGSGTIINANLGTSGSQMETPPTHTSVLPGVTATVGGQVADSSNSNVISSIPTTPGTPVTPPSGGGGGGSSVVSVSGISVTGASNATIITTNAGTLQMSVAVIPAGATNKTVTWSVTNTDGTATDKATISNIGLLTAVKDGTVIVKATSVSTGNVNGTLAITISNQTVEPAAVTYATSGTLTNATVSVANGTTEADAKLALNQTVGVVGTNGETGTATIAWTIAGYSATTAGSYTATGVITLPAGWTGAPLNVTATVTAQPVVLSDVTSPTFTTVAANNTVTITLTNGTFKAGEITKTDFTFTGTDAVKLGSGSFIRVSDTEVRIIGINGLTGGDNTVLVKAATQEAPATSVGVVSSTTPEGYFSFTASKGEITAYNVAGGKNVVIPSTLGGVAVQSIGTNAFNNIALASIKALTSVTIPDSVKSIGTSAFEHNNLTSITIPNSVTSIDSHAFFENKLTSVTIGAGVKTIGAGAFAHNNLTSITIPNNVTGIDDKAFQDNVLTSITIGPNVSIGDYLLSGTLNGYQNSFRDAYYAGKEGTYIGTQGGSWTLSQDALAVVAATAGTNTITYTLTTGTFSAAATTIDNWTIAGADKAGLGAITGVVLSNSNKTATITVTNNVEDGKSYTIAPAQAAFAAGFTAPVAETVAITAGDPTVGATTELTKIADVDVKIVPFGTTNDKTDIEAAMLVLANAEVDSINYTVTIAEGSTYVGNVWTGKFVVTNKTTAANTKTDAANRNITVVIAADLPAFNMKTVGMSGTAYTSPTTYPSNDDPNGIIYEGYQMAETETTYELWHSVRVWAQANNYTFQNLGREGNDGTDGGDPTVAKFEPVTNISWRDTIVWLNALSEMEGLAPVYRTTDTIDGEIIRSSADANGTVVDAALQTANNGYRLPTINEWQMAARWIGTTAPTVGALASDVKITTVAGSTYYWTPRNYASGATAPTTDSAASQEVQWYNINSDQKTHDVGGKKANALGLKDMNGNVWEWCFGKAKCGGGYGYENNSIVGFTGWFSGTMDNEMQVDIGFRLAKGNVGLPSAAEAAALITTIKAPTKDETQLTIPIVTGYTIAIKSSDNLEVIALDRKIAPPAVATTVALVLEITRKSDNSKAETVPINVIVPENSFYMESATIGGSWGDGGIVEAAVTSGFKLYSVDLDVSHNILNIFAINENTGEIIYRASNSSIWSSYDTKVPNCAIPDGFQPLGVMGGVPYIINSTSGAIQHNDGTGYIMDGNTVALPSGYIPLGAYCNDSMENMIVIMDPISGKVRQRELDSDTYGDDIGLTPVIPAGYIYAGLGYKWGPMYMYICKDK